MKKVILFSAIIICIASCKGNQGNFEEKGYDFDNFKNTPLEVAAIAARNNDGQKIRELLSKHKDIIDLKEPLFHQTLLSLTIQNKKRDAFTALLELGANPNVMLSDPADATPLIRGIKTVENCDLFFVKQMLAHGADPNLEVKRAKGQGMPNKSFPLLVAITNLTDKGEECVDLVKLLVDHGADINACQEAPTGFCEGVVMLSLRYERMENLRYFVIDKKIKLPEVAFVRGSINKATEERYSLSEALKLPRFQYNDPEHARWKKINTEILSYLKTKK